MQRYPLLITFLFASHCTGEFKNTWCEEVPVHCFLMMTYSLCLFSVEISRCVFARARVSIIYTVLRRNCCTARSFAWKHLWCASLDEFRRIIRRFLFLLKSTHSELFRIKYECQSSACIVEKTLLTWVLATSRELRAFFYILFTRQHGRLNGPCTVTTCHFSSGFQWKLWSRRTLAQLLRMIDSWPFYLYALSWRVCVV